MKTHIKVIGWLWILNAVVSILMLIIGLIIVNASVSSAQDATLVTIGGLCFFIPGTIANFLAGYGLLQYKNWARILAIILAIINLPLFPIGTAVGIYTLVIMFNKETKVLFSSEGTPPQGEEVS
jgi:hypothetical protein